MAYVAPHERTRQAPPVSAVVTPGAPLVPRDLIVRVGRLAGFAVYFVGATPCYKERNGSVEKEVEFVLPHIAFRIMKSAPDLIVIRDGDGYSCTLKAGQNPQRGATLVEAVFRAFADAKSATAPRVVS